jgi:membrane dipeptidase
MRNVNRRQFVQGALAASCALPYPAWGGDTPPVFIGDMHSHLFFFGMGRSPARSPLGPQMAAGNATLVAWSLVGDVPWLRITGKGIKQKGSPKRGEAIAWFEDDIARIKQHCAEQGLKLALTADDVDKALAGEPHVVLTVEGATFVEDDPAPLAHAYELGVRSVQLVHYIDNPLGDFQTEAPQHDGLTDLGRRVVAECNRLGMLVDLAHCTDAAVLQALEASTQPVVWSHSSVTRTRQPSWKMPVWQARQLTLSTAKRIAEKGGVVGVWPMRSDVGATPETYAERVWELGEWLGVDHVGFGTDMNAISRPAVASYADLQQAVRHWQRAGFPRESIDKLAIGNFARVLKAAMSARQA